MTSKNSRFIQFSDSALLTIVGLILAHIFALTKNEKNVHFSIPKAETISQSISWKEGQQMRNLFKSLQPMMIEVPDERNPGSNIAKPLEGFKISASHLLEIINQNKNGGIADEVMFYFGAESAKAGFIYPTFHIIAVGMENNRLMIPESTEEQGNAKSSSVYDKADPCLPCVPTK